ncbi:hypothetical protein BDQ17DRAFT_1081805 [Cyathus striatus]|nr:hypothetical protein BDQ17DRAFT_1081805 [Cyathus striatus]
MGGLLDVYDFHIIPVPNPDGYDYTWEYDRFWYKNRQIISPKAKCIGIDMNRNWGYKWKPDGDGNGMLQPTLNVSLTADVNDATDTDAVGGASVKPKPADPCSHWYPGLRAFEAPEANNIANFVNTLPDVVAFVDLRSYGQMLSSPYSYSCKRMPKDAEDQIEAALGATQALKKAYGTAFKTGSVCQMLYRAPGNIVDWMYARAGIKYSYVAHLRDTGTYGFSLPEKWIRPVGEETGNMVGYITEFIAKHIGRQT